MLWEVSHVSVKVFLEAKFMLSGEGVAGLVRAALGEAGSEGLCWDTAATLGSQVLESFRGWSGVVCSPSGSPGAPSVLASADVLSLRCCHGDLPGGSSPTSVFLGPRQEVPLPGHFTPARGRGACPGWWDVPGEGSGLGQQSEIWVSTCSNPPGPAPGIPAPDL